MLGGDLTKPFHISAVVDPWMIAGQRLDLPFIVRSELSVRVADPDLIRSHADRPADEIIGVGLQTVDGEVAYVRDELSERFTPGRVNPMLDTLPVTGPELDLGEAGPFPFQEATIRLIADT
jgi:hypothetical protein